MDERTFGISGFSMFVPPYRVALEEWCEWTGNSWEKTQAVIGKSFRVAGPEHSVYTMAASATLRLILDHEVDPRSVGYLAVGTESGTDNATSAAIVVRGLVDQALEARGLPRLARDIEAPEFKQACLGGVYGLKGALRYLAVDGGSRCAIVVAADIAEYARASSGEPTQGAGAVAMLVDVNPRLLSIDVRGSASASSYRAVDFRKPFLRYFGQTPEWHGRPRDFPVFNGKYSTACYIDSTMSSLSAFFVKRKAARLPYIRELGAVFMHRPYHRMPHAAWALAYLFALGTDGDQGHAELAAYAAAAGVDMASLLDEMRSSPDLLGSALAGKLIDEPFPLSARLIKPLKQSRAYQETVEQKMKLGSMLAMEFGNLYAASLPAWLAAGLEEAAESNLALEGRDVLLIGYGSGDASEVLPAKVVRGWRAAASRSCLKAALSDAIDLSHDEYDALHAGRSVDGLARPAKFGFVVDRVGTADHPTYQDRGIEFYRELA